MRLRSARILSSVEPVKCAICRSENPRPFALLKISGLSGGIGATVSRKSFRLSRGLNHLAVAAGLRYETGVKKTGRALLWLTLFVPVLASAQIDPVRRDLIQFGYNQPVEGRSPLAAYAFFYHNQPDFLRTNLTLRLAVAPVYLDSELGFVGGLGPHTDFAIGLAGGGFADSYSEIRGGTYLRGESFDGNGAEISASIYHLFNPGDEIPLNLVLRGTAHYSTYGRNDSTAPAFQLPDDDTAFSVRTGLRSEEHTSELQSHSDLVCRL